MRERGRDRIRTGALAVLLTGVLAVGVAYGAAFFRTPPPGWAAWLMAAGTVGAIVAVMALGAVKGGRLGGLWLAFAAVAILVGGGFGALLALPSTGSADADLFMGLPQRAAILLYGIGLLPTLVVPVAYALTFDRLTLSEDDLERVRRARRRRETAENAAGAGSAVPGRRLGPGEGDAMAGKPPG
ncbi:MAG: hypothetical protein GWM92_08540 [Gemmatimonadetes bacterium]|nr:hypothetical protein [Gemmatimonadota bacterium]NIR79454.1 hypothetical protein [Gemmatimonadota bacterium]NIT87318.1 hypothetical protein [Gemmatimonadota bacterium]NIU31162.1 hypothetical protein [Gemmatimonadota bacterium]NIU35888.1 hypothetical protein [Gemmatimonadota bacterium]